MKNTKYNMLWSYICYYYIYTRNKIITNWRIGLKIVVMRSRKKDVGKQLVVEGTT